MGWVGTHDTVVAAIVITNATTLLVLAVVAARDAALAVGGNDADQGEDGNGEGDETHLDGWFEGS